MTSRAAITVLRNRDELERLWDSPERIRELGAAVTFKDAPGDRGTEVHVDLGKKAPRQLAKVKDELRRFKQRVETGEIPRSDSTPEGERVERKFKQRPARPLDESELAKIGAS